VREHSGNVFVVSEDEISAAIRFFLTRMKIVVEPSGGVAAAAALNRRVPREAKRIGVIITGGNIDLEMLASIGSG
jgi:threonine dehydratase